VTAEAIAVHPMKNVAEWSQGIFAVAFLKNVARGDVAALYSQNVVERNPANFLNTAVKICFAAILHRNAARGKKSRIAAERLRNAVMESVAGWVKRAAHLLMRRGSLL
jgi:hypothetical protein